MCIAYHDTYVTKPEDFKPCVVVRTSQDQDVDLAVVSGDNIFEGGGVGRTDFPLSNPKNFEKSIAKILELPHDTIVYPGHIYEHFSNDMFTIGDWYRQRSI